MTNEEKIANRIACPEDGYPESEALYKTEEEFHSRHSEKIVHLELKQRVVERFLLVLEAVTDADDHSWAGFLETVEYEDIEFWKRMLTEALEKSK